MVSESGNDRAEKQFSKFSKGRRIMNKEEAKERLGFLAVVATFGVILLAIFVMIGLDLVKKM
jgi:hypothetical protein